MKTQTVTPKISLSIDNCFLSKRYTLPADWTGIINDLGIKLIEASADTECDPLYTGKRYIRKWKKDVMAACRNSGTKVVNLYSGHGTYATLGLSHTDRCVSKRIKNKWIIRQVETASSLDAGLGFFTHAFDMSVLENVAAYRNTMNQLINDLSDVALYCKERGVCAGVEQMYTPHQPPWTVSGAENMLRDIYRYGAPLYITLDTGHMSLQSKWVKPNIETIEWAIIEKDESIWLGTECAYSLFLKALESPALAAAAKAKEILKVIEEYDYLFCESSDAEIYNWIEKLVAYSPIVHLQQTDGKASAHLSFTAMNNASGLIQPKKLFKAIAKAYSKPVDKTLPERCEHIFLTLEPFIATAGNIHEELLNIKESVNYWRVYIPEDGMPLETILKRISE